MIADAAIDRPDRHLTLQRSRSFLLAGLILVLGNVAVASGVYLAFATPAVGFAAVVGIPTFLLYRADVGDWRNPGERLLASVVLTILVLMALGLAVNAVGPSLGVDHPLGSASVVVMVDGLCAGLAVFSWRRKPSPSVLVLRAPGSDWALRGWAMTSVPVAAMGATRLNNGAGGGLATVAVGIVIAGLLALFVRRSSVSEGTLLLVLYSSALALLLTTSLRGWYTTGHDVQHEMSVFLATKQAGHWATRAHDAYAACLSITILPTIVSRWTRVFDPYVYKVFFQLLYALSPLMVYRLAVRWTSRTTALLCAFYFIGFVGFLQDMPMLNRQEMGFLFFGVALIALRRDELAMGSRRSLFLLFAVGMVLAHYSTTYFAVAAFGLAWLLRVSHSALRGWRERRGTVGRLALVDLRPSHGYALSAALVVAMASLSLVWTGPVTHSGPGLGRVVHRALHVSFTGKGQRSSDTSYALLPFSRGVSEQGALDSFVEDAAAIRHRDPQAHFADSAATASARLAKPVLLPPSSIGRAMERVGIPVHGTNRAVRLACALGLQVLIGVGVLQVLLRRRDRPATDIEAILLGIAMALLVALQVVLPSVSLDYGLGRSFMQALIVLGPLIVIGSRSLVWGRASRWSERVAIGLALTFVVSSTGLLPQVLGGYGAQLHLNNSGSYYDVFLVHEQEVASMEWTKANLLVVRPYPDLQMDLPLVNTSLSIGGLFPSVGIHPAIVRRGSVVLLGYLNIVRHQGEVRAEGLDVRYRLDERFFDEVKDRLYDAGTARVFR